MSIETNKNSHDKSNKPQVPTSNPQKKEAKGQKIDHPGAQTDVGGKAKAAPKPGEKKAQQLEN